LLLCHCGQVKYRTFVAGQGGGDRDKEEEKGTGSQHCGQNSLLDNALDVRVLLLINNLVPVEVLGQFLF